MRDTTIFSADTDEEFGSNAPWTAEDACLLGYRVSAQERQSSFGTYRLICNDLPAFKQSLFARGLSPKHFVGRNQ